MENDVKVYMSPTCPFCKKAKEMLTENKIEFTALDVTSDRNALNEMIEVSGARSVPVISMCNEIMVGFDGAKMEQMINCYKQRSEV